MHPAKPDLHTAAARPLPAGGAFGENGADFGDVLDTVNPLHHLPVVGFIYRSLSGDAIAPAARIAGGALFGGPVGAAFGLLSAALEPRSGSRPADAESSNPAPDSRGGWIVQAARRPGLPAVAPASTGPRVASEDGPASAPGAPVAADRPRPGGWIVNAAYAGRSAAPRAVDTTA